MKRNIALSLCKNLFLMKDALAKINFLKVSISEWGEQIKGSCFSPLCFVFLSVSFLFSWLLRFVYTMLCCGTKINIGTTFESIKLVLINKTLYGCPFMCRITMQWKAGFTDASCICQIVLLHHDACVLKPCDEVLQIDACPSYGLDVGKPRQGASGAWAWHSWMPSCAPSSTSSGDSGTRFLFVVLSDIVRVQFQFFSAWSGSG